MKQTLILDSSQLSTLLECPEKWYLSQHEHLVQINHYNLRGIDNPDEALVIAESNRPKDTIAAGSLGHKYLELYYRSLGLGLSPQESVRSTLDFNPDAADKLDAGEYPLDQKLSDRIKRRICDYVMTYGSRDYTVCSRREAAIGVDENDILFDTYKFQPLVEQGFSYHLYEDKDYLFILEGRIDLICETQGTTLWLDHKFQFREKELYRKSIQFRNYALATGLDLGIINYVRLHDKIGPTTFVRQPISFSPYERRMWKEELIGIYMGFAKDLAANRRVLNKGACSGRYNEICEFTSLCEEYNPTTKEMIKARDYTKRKEWRPW